MNMIDCKTLKSIAKNNKNSMLLFANFTIVQSYRYHILCILNGKF